MVKCTSKELTLQNGELKKMTKVTIKNVECYGNIQDADCILVSSCDNDFVISPRKNWTETVAYILNDDIYMQQLAKNGELQLEVA